MTSRKSYFNFKLFKQSAKQQKYIVLLHTILLFLCTTLPAVIEYNNSMNGNPEKYTFQTIAELLSGLNPIIMLLLLAAAIITSISLFNFLYKPQSVLFYHSMEHTRESIYISRFSAGVFTLILPLVPLYIINTAVFAAFGVTEYIGISIMLKGFLTTTLMYICVFAVSTFAASVSGNFFAQLGMTAFVFLVYVVSASVIQGTFYTILENISLSFHFNAAYIFPPTILVDWQYDPADIKEIIFAIIYTIAFAAAGLVLYKNRKSESTGKFFAYGKLTAFLKYYISFFAALCFGLVFAEMSEKNIIISLFGYVIGAFLSFVILQGIFGKNFKAMFENMRGFAILAVCTAAVVAVPLINPGMFYILPNAAVVRSVNVDTHGNGYYNHYRLKTKANVLNVLTAMNAESDSNGEYDISATINSDNKLFSLKYRKSVSADKYAEYMKSIYDTEEFKSIMLNRMKVDEDEFPWVELERHAAYVINTNSGIHNREEVNNLVNMFKAEYAKYTYDDVASSNVYAIITINGERHKVYECYADTVNCIKEKYKDDIEYQTDGLKELTVSCSADYGEAAATESEDIATERENEVITRFSAEYNMEAIEKILAESVSWGDTNGWVTLNYADGNERRISVNIDNYSHDVKELILMKQLKTN